MLGYGFWGSSGPGLAVAVVGYVDLPSVIFDPGVFGRSLWMGGGKIVDVILCCVLGP